MDTIQLLIIALFILVVCVAGGLFYVNYRNRVLSDEDYGERHLSKEDSQENDKIEDWQDKEDEEYSEEQENSQTEHIMSKNKNNPNRYGDRSYADAPQRSEQDRRDRSNSYGYYQSTEMRRASTNSNANSVDESKPSTVAIIYRSEMDYISRCIHDYPNIETGGQLFGFLTENGSPVVCYAIGPGPRANHQGAFFNQDTHYLQSVFDQINSRWGLRYIGEWHSHHQLGLAKPSGHDARTIIRGMQRSNFRHFLLCIGNCDDQYHSTLNAFTFHLNDPYNYIQAPWKIIECESPYRAIIDSELDQMLEHPRFRKASHGRLYTVDQGGQQAVVIPDYSSEYWLNNKANNLVLKQMLDFLMAEEPNSMVKPMLDDKKRVHLIVERPGRKEHIIFGDYFPETAPVILNQADESLKDDQGWNYSGDILNAFTRYYRGALRAERLQKEEQRRKEAMEIVSSAIKSRIDAQGDSAPTEPATQEDIERLKAEFTQRNISQAGQKKPEPKTQSNTTPDPPTKMEEQDAITERIYENDEDLTKKVEQIRQDEANMNITSMDVVDEAEVTQLDFGASEIQDANAASEEALQKETIPSLKEGIEQSYGDSDQIVGLEEVRDEKDTSLTDTSDLIPEYKQSVSYNERASEESSEPK